MLYDKAILHPIRNSKRSSNPHAAILIIRATRASYTAARIYQ